MTEDGEILSVRRVIFWWESRRILFNLALLVIGILSLIGFEFLMNKALPVGKDAEEPFG